jgi:hypothetical protein
MGTGYKSHRAREDRPFQQEKARAPDPPSTFDACLYDDEESTQVTKMHREVREKLRTTDSRLSSLTEKIQELLDLASSEKAAGAT